jgi:MoxR-like ATPase
MTQPRFLEPDCLPPKTWDLDGSDAWPASRHQFEADAVDALNAALATDRPLLLRGEPGVGKSQLARAAAKALGRAFASVVVDGRTESNDLLWHFDAVGRLAEAQLQGALRHQDSASVRTALEPQRFVVPKALWWALDWDSAKAQFKAVGLAPPPISEELANAGWVVLIDEIDKADPSVPNGLLDALGHRRFESPCGRVQSREAGVPPLVVITSNEERTLPDAFLRRCWVWEMVVPDNTDAEFIKWMVPRGRAHFPELADMPDDLLEACAKMVWDHRQEAKRVGVGRPGQAEYLDLLLAVQQRCDTVGDRRALLAKLQKFALKKHLPARADS